MHTGKGPATDTETFYTCAERHRHTHTFWHNDIIIIISDIPLVKLEVCTVCKQSPVRCDAVMVGACEGVNEVARRHEKHLAR